MSPTLGAGSSSGSSDSFSDRQFIAITSEKTARVIALPSQNCVYRQQIADTDYVVKAEVISLKGTLSHFQYIYSLGGKKKEVKPKTADKTQILHRKHISIVVGSINDILCAIRSFFLSLISIFIFLSYYR